MSDLREKILDKLFEAPNVRNADEIISLVLDEAIEAVGDIHQQVIFKDYAIKAIEKLKDSL